MTTIIPPITKDLPENPVMGGVEFFTPGTCFDSTGLRVFEALKRHDMLICHGIQTLRDGRPNGHSWLEFQKMETAMCPISGAVVPVKEFYDKLGITYVKKHNLLEWIGLYIRHNYPGPWDEKIKAVMSQGSEGGR